MFYVGGDKESFRCEDCGCNVFRRTAKRSAEQYKCNGCGTTYTVVAPEGPPPKGE